MTPPRMEMSSAPDTAWQEAIYTHARLSCDPLTADLAAPFKGFSERALEVQREQRERWEAELLAQAQVAFFNAELDDRCEQVEREALRAFDSDRQHKTFRLLFPEGLSRLTKQALATQLQSMSGWLVTLGVEEALRPLAPSLADLMAQGKAAVEARAEASAQTAVHRVKRIEPLIQDLNAARDSAYADLLKLAATHGKRKDWARSFFRR